MFFSGIGIIIVMKYAIKLHPSLLKGGILPQQLLHFCCDTYFFLDAAEIILKV